MIDWKKWLSWKTLFSVPSIIVLSLAGLGGVVHYSETPSFCRSCHIMEPYYKAWNDSKHKNVKCVECHYPPAQPKTLLWKKFQAFSQVAKYVTRTYSSKPFAEVDDSSCLRSGCHSTRLLEGKIRTKGGINFDHRPHLTEVRRGRKLRCTSCHGQVMVGNHIEVTYDTCYLCHFKGRGEGRELKPLGGCQACHDTPKETIALAGMKFNHKEYVTNRKLDCQSCHVNLVHGQGSVREDRCFTCHNEAEKIARFKEVEFMHDHHVSEKNVACFHCHDTIRHGFRDGANGAVLAKVGEPPREHAAPAGQAHTGAFDCAYCHQKMHGGQQEMYTGRAPELGLPNMPSPMHEANVDCVGCHFAKKANGDGGLNGKTFKASQAACVKCHGPKFQGIWEETKAALAGTLGKVQAKANAMGASAASSSAARGEPAAAKSLKHAQDLLRFVKSGKGEHNIYLSSLALRRADAALAEAGAKLGSQGEDLSALPLLSGAYCATLCHEKAGVKVPPESVKVFGKSMPHKMHADMMGCVQCHEIGGHKKTPLKKGVKGKCAECHPE